MVFFFAFNEHKMTSSFLTNFNRVIPRYTVREKCIPMSVPLNSIGYIRLRYTSMRSSIGICRCRVRNTPHSKQGSGEYGNKQSEFGSHHRFRGGVDNELLGVGFGRLRLGF
mgnify:CR=1 FL=1